MNDFPKIPERRSALPDNDSITPEDSETPLWINERTGLNHYHQ